ncbi:peptide deformylase [Tetzosporium hominis]|uniref:Peptide deformylase n=1 Tax=Tetzosporium hominis TaxID=2020506 RepID=A0A264W6M3_9BACL|nr:peptide deformylase [Tetzosporium hominis]OZS79236.1 peptide deformylase [Tetzosporium hominis]
MTILKIITHPNDILTTPAKEVTKFDSKLAQLLDDMYDTMVAADGIGLAAPQVGVSKRVAIVDLGEGQDVIEMINPVVVAIGGKEVEVEGCLSFPDIYGEVERPFYVKIEAEDRDGNLYELEAEDYEARAIQHEIDHLNGILFTSKIIRYVTPDEFMEEEEEEL